MLVAATPVLREEGLDASSSRFVLEPLEPGFGHTLGHSLRRALLNAPGFAATRLVVTGFSGDDEEFSDLVLAVKDLALRSDLDEATLTLTASGPGELTASALVLPDGVELLNPDLVLTTLAPGDELSITVEAASGVGYRVVDAPAPSARELDLDALHSPTSRAELSVVATRVEQRTDFDSMVLEVTTRASSTPRAELSAAATRMRSLASMMAALSPGVEGLELSVLSEPEAIEDVSLDDLGLSVRTKNSLQRAGVSLLSELSALSEDSLKSLSGLGERSLEEINLVLSERGLVDPS